MSKLQNYKEIYSMACSLVEGESNLVANLANITSLLKEKLNHFWIGFYLVENDQLVLGPFQGTLACTRIDFGKGVCGSAWKEQRTFLVDNVHEFAGHIACSSLSNSEIVVPVIYENKVVAVLDIDSTEFSTFDQIDKTELEKICEMLATKCNW